MTHKFVEYIPEQIEEGIIYVSLEYGTVVHKCCCGCGKKVFTPLSPTDWKLIFDGESISLYPSIGSWNLECKSHYWIRNNMIEWSTQWSEKEIKTGRHQEALETKKHYKNKKRSSKDNPSSISENSKKDNLSSKLKKWWSK